MVKITPYHHVSTMLRAQYPSQELRRKVSEEVGKAELKFPRDDTDEGFPLPP
jgi:hypothetical protein